jgi:PAS domain S-box-containing protein
MKKTSIPPPKAADPSTRSGQAPSTGSGRSLRRKAEAKMSKRKKAVASPMTEADTLRLVHELEVHQIELELQNEELVGAQAELEALLHQYTGLYDFAPAGYFTLARDGMINRANLAGANLLGVERSRLVKKHFGVFVSAKTRPVFNAFLGEVFESEGKETCEVALQKNGADPIWVNIEAIKEDERGCRVLVEDITGRKQAEEKADEARVFAESIIATVRQPLLVLDADLHVITANRSFYEVFKVKQEETEGKLLYELGNHQWNISK